MQTSVPDRVIRMELISLFTLYPDLTGSCDEIAGRLERNSAQVERQMDDLVRLRILERYTVGSRNIYRYISPLSINLMGRKEYGLSAGNPSHDADTVGAIDEKSAGYGTGVAVARQRGSGMRMRLMISARNNAGWRERTAERLLQDGIYWNTVHKADISKGLEDALASAAKGVEAQRVSVLVSDEAGCLRTLSTYGYRMRADVKGGVFLPGRGVAGWCVDNRNSINLRDPRTDTRFIASHYDDIDSILCSPLIPTYGKVMGAICAVNKKCLESGPYAGFNAGDMRLLEGIARKIAHAMIDRDNATRRFSYEDIKERVAALSL